MQRPFAVLLMLWCACAAAAAAPDSAPREDNPTEKPPLTLPEVLDLETAQAAALEHNPSLDAAAARIEAARARVAQARATYFPWLDVSTGASKTELSDKAYEQARNAAIEAQIQQVPSTLLRVLTQSQTYTPQAALAETGFGFLGALQQRNAVEDSVDNYTAALTATWTLFDGFAREFGHKAARYGKLESEAAYRETQRLILSATAAAFYNAQLQRESIRIAQEDEEFNKRQLADAQARRRVGTGALSEELNFEVRVRASQASVLLAEKNCQIALIGLAELMGIEEGALPDTVTLAELATETPAELSAPPVGTDLLAYAREHRPDLVLSEYSLLRTKASLGSARAPFYPRVAAVLSHDASRSDEWSFDNDDFSTTIGINFSYSIFAGGYNRAALSQAKALHKEAQHNLRGSEVSVAAEVQEAVINVTNAQKELALQLETTDYVERNRGLVEKEYKVGQTSLVRLNEAQRDLNQAQLRLAQARVALRQAWYNLRTATAENLESFAE